MRRTDRAHRVAHFGAPGSTTRPKLRMPAETLSGEMDPATPTAAGHLARLEAELWRCTGVRRAQGQDEAPAVAKEGSTALVTAEHEGPARAREQEDADADAEEGTGSRRRKKKERHKEKKRRRREQQEQQRDSSGG